MVKRLVVSDWASVGVHVSTPLLGPSTMPLGAFEDRAIVNAFAGKSASLAAIGQVRVKLSKTSSSGTGAMTGGWFISSTQTSKLAMSSRGGRPLSVTRTTKVCQ